MSGKIFKNKSAKDLFPALFKGDQNHDLAEVKDTEPKKQAPPAVKINLPASPDTKWLRQKDIEDKSESTDEVPRALVVTDIIDNLTIYTKLLKSLLYAVDHTHTESAAIRSISTIPYSLIVYENTLTFGRFEKYMRKLSGSKRRNLLYVIVGPDLKTLYNLQALSLSANTVINNKDIKYFNLIIKKSFHDYEALFGPYLEILESSKGSSFG